MDRVDTTSAAGDQDGLQLISFFEKVTLLNFISKRIRIDSTKRGWGCGISRVSTAALAMVCLVLCGCTLTLIGNYDDVIDKGMTDFQQKVETYISKLESNPATPYDSAFYDDAFARLAAMRSRAQASYKKGYSGSNRWMI